jgi:hypothetical protein
MKNLIFLAAFLYSSLIAAQPYKVNHWYTLTGGPAITGESGFHIGAEAHLALDNKVFTLGYRLHNYNEMRSGSITHDIYFTPGFHFPISKRFNMDFRLGPMLTIITGPLLTDNSNTETSPSFFPSLMPQLQGSFKFNRQWALSTGVALNIPVGFYSENWLQLSLGLRFGDWPTRAILPKDKRKASRKQKQIKQDFYLSALGGGHTYGFAPGLEFGIVTGKWLLKLGYFNSTTNNSRFSLSGYYVGTGVEFEPLKYKRLLAHVIAGAGNIQLTERYSQSFPGQIVEVDFGTQAFILVTQAGLSFKLTRWLYLTGEYSLLIQDIDEANGLGQGGLQLRF